MVPDSPLSPPVPLRDPSDLFMRFLSAGGFRWSLSWVFIPPKESLLRPTFCFLSEGVLGEFVILNFPSWPRKSQLAAQVLWDFPGGQMVKNLPCNSGDVGSIPGWGTDPTCPRATEALHSGAPVPQLQSCVPHQRPCMLQRRPNTAK